MLTVCFCILPVFIHYNGMGKSNKYIHQNIYFHAGLKQRVDEQMIEHLIPSLKKKNLILPFSLFNV